MCLVCGTTISDPVVLANIFVFDCPKQLEVISFSSMESRLIPRAPSPRKATIRKHFHNLAKIAP